jgi:hypothetical protein
MKKCTYLFLLVFVLFSASGVFAVVADCNEEWGIYLDEYESITCVAFFAHEGMVFDETPVFTDTYEDYKFDDNYAGYNPWDTAESPELSVDGLAAYIWGPVQREPFGFQPLAWFSVELYYQWDQDYPIIIDVVMFNEETVVSSSGWKNTTGDSSAWQYNEEQFAEEPYTNPVPEPATMVILALGAGMLRIRKNG